MSIHRLKKIAELKHLSEYTIDELITSFSLYQKAIVSTKDINIDLYGSERSVFVSADIQRINELMCNIDCIMLPCAECGQKLPFRSKMWGNPQNLEGTVIGNNESGITLKTTVNPFVDNIQKSYTQNAFEIAAPVFRIGKNELGKWDVGDEDKAKTKKELNTYVKKCVDECKSTLLSYAGEIRKDYFCTYQSHRVFVNFRVYDPIEPEDSREYCELLSSPYEEDKKACKAYEYLGDCLVIQKIGQYPSLADMQLSDMEKYRRILEKDSYSDFARANFLFADEIGCGSFLYLRRVFEKLIEKKHQECAASEGEKWNEEDYKNKHVDERIQLLENKGYKIIPNELNQVKDKLYGVLSKGVHECTDDLCVELFPYVKFAIEIILDEELRKRDLAEKIKALPKQLEKIGTK